MAFQIQLQGKATVRSVKEGKQGEGMFATLEELEGKYRGSVNVALPPGQKLNEGEVVEFTLMGSYRTFNRDGRSFSTFFADDFRATRFTVTLTPAGEVGKGSAGPAAAKKQ